jgi:hypothetical protein
MTSRILDVWVLAAAGIQLGALWVIKLSIPPMQRHSFHSVVSRSAPH